MSYRDSAWSCSQCRSSVRQGQAIFSTAEGCRAGAHVKTRQWQLQHSYYSSGQATGYSTQSAEHASMDKRPDSKHADQRGDCFLGYCTVWEGPNRIRPRRRVGRWVGARNHTTNASTTVGDCTPCVRMSSVMRSVIAPLSFTPRAKVDITDSADIAPH